MAMPYLNISELSFIHEKARTISKIHFHPSPISQLHRHQLDPQLFSLRLKSPVAFRRCSSFLFAFLFAKWSIQSLLGSIVLCYWRFSLFSGQSVRHGQMTAYWQWLLEPIE